MLFVLLIFVSNWSQAALDLDKYVGKYTSNYYDGSYKGRFVATFEKTPFGLAMTLISGWNQRINGNTYEFDCDAETQACISAFSEIGCEVELKLLGSGNFIYKCNSSSYLFTPYIGTPPASKGWETQQTVDSEGRLSVLATVKNKKQKTEVIVQCTAPSPDLKMVLKVNKTLWRAIAYSVENKQENLQVEMTARKKSKHQISNWTLDNEGNALLRVDNISENEITDLKRGAVVIFNFQSVNSEQDKTQLGQIKFSLKDSSKALSSLKERCTETTPEEN